MADSSVSDLDDLFKGAEVMRRPFEADAYLNLAFYSGQQWVAYDGNMLFEPQLEDWREKVVDNRIRPFVRTEIAKMTKTRPQWVGVPRSQSDVDVAGARYAEDCLDDSWVKANMLRKLRAGLLWSRVCKAGFWKIWWDPTVGEPQEVLVWADGHEQAGRLVRDQNGAPMSMDALQRVMPEGMQPPVQTRQVSPGDYCIDLRTFFEIYPDPHAGEEGLESAEYVMEEAVYSRAYVRRHMPDWYDRLSFDANPNGGITQSRWPSLQGSANSVPTLAKGVKLREYWDKDMHVIWTKNGDILLEEANPYGWLPYVMFRGSPVPGRFWPDCTVDDLRPRQVDLNKRLSQIAENAERIGNPPLTVPSSMGDDWQWSGLPGETVPFQDNGSPQSRPQFMEVPEMPAYIQNDVDRIISSMMDISGQHEVSSGQVPAGVTAASAINLLQEQDDTRLGPDIADMEIALAQAGQRLLDLIDRYYDQARLIRISGDDGAWDVASFKENMLKGCAEVQVQAGSGMPQSKAARQAAIRDTLQLLVQNGAQLTERQLRRILSEYEVGGLEQFFADTERTERQIQEENREMSLMSAGGVYPINDYDDDPAHIDGHTDFQRTPRYKQLPPGAQQTIAEHVKQHRTRMLSATAAGAAPQPGAVPGQQAMPPGTPSLSTTGQIPSVTSTPPIQ